MKKEAFSAIVLLLLVLLIPVFLVSCGEAEPTVPVRISRPAPGFRLVFVSIPAFLATCLRVFIDGTAFRTAPPLYFAPRDFASEIFCPDEIKSINQFKALKKQVEWMAGRYAAKQLARHFLEMFAAKNHKNIKGFTPRALDRLIRYEWPGNVRQLMNAVERTVVLSRAEFLSERDFPSITGADIKDDEDPSDTTRININGDKPLEEVEKATILKTLEAAGGNKSETARRLGITRKTLHKKLKSYGVMK